MEIDTSRPEENCAYCGGPLDEAAITVYGITEYPNYERKVMVKRLYNKGKMHNEPCARFWRRSPDWGGEIMQIEKL